MQTSNQKSPRIFHMSLAEPIIIFIISVLGIVSAVWLFWIGVGDFIKTILLLLLSMAGAFYALTMARKLELAGSELTISYLVSKRVIAREDIDSFFLGEQGFNRRTRKFVTIHLANGRRITFKGVQEGNQSLLQALEDFTGLKPAVEQTQEMQ